MFVADQSTIKRLNILLKGKLTGINQYFLHARMLKHMGEVKLADQEYKVSIDAMKHSDMLVEHILTIGGLPNLQALDNLMIGETPEEMLRNDLKHVEMSILNIEDALEFCKNSDTTDTLALLHKLLESQRERISMIHSQLSALDVKISHLEKDCA